MNKRPRKKWMIIYLYSAVTNVIMDKILTHYELISYPTRLFPKIFRIHILFDTLLYPLANVIYNQIAKKDKILVILYKSIYFSVPLLIVETWAERNTGLIKWGNAWRGYHTFLGVNFNTLFTRLIVVRIYRRLCK
ncbi:CBO0543 family protein [Paenibacillus wynnii]